MRPELSRMLWVCGAFLSVALQLFGAFQMSRMIWFTWPSTGNPSEKWQFLSSPPVLKICADITSLIIRSIQITLWAVGCDDDVQYYVVVLSLYWMWPWLLLLYPVRNVDWLDIPGAAGGEIGIFFGVTVAIIYEAAFTVSQTLASPFSDWVAGRKVIRAAAYFASADSTYLSPAKRNWTCLSLIRPPSRGPISLPADALDALDVNSADSWQAPLQFSESVGQWGTDISDFQALWITSHTRNLRDMGAIVRDILLNDVPGPDIALVDVSRSRSPIWPLIHGLTLTSAPYRYRIARSQPEPFSSYFWLNVFRPSTFHGTSGFWDVSPTVANDYDMFDTLVCRPLEAAAERLSKSSHVDHETAYFPGLPPVVLIVHGLRDRKHAEDLYHFITQLRFVRQPVRIVAVSDPSLPRHVFEHNADVLLNTRTLYISDTGSVVYSGRRYQPPFFYEHLFALFVDAMHRSCGTNAERMLSTLDEISIISVSGTQEEDTADAALSILRKLHSAWLIRKRILQCSSMIPEILPPEIKKAVVQDNAKIAETLQEFLLRKSYKAAISQVPREWAWAALNVTNSMLDHGFAYDNSIRDQHIFTRHAHRFLNSLAAHLELLPQEMSITGIVLSCPHPISGGGFANVYRGQYTDADGVQVDVALKALRIFQNQTEDALAALHKKFVKEALVWYHLRHDNIVPFLGVDSTTFPGPARAMMVSPWMPLGSVLRYIASISTDYAVVVVNLLNDTIQGLAYLHSAGVVHGDLHCRNILIDYDGRARLVDFGLARFVDSETSLKSSTRGGVPRWMAPELLLAQEGAFRRTPASDVWAFGCVSCEIWSGGTVPFAGFGEAFFVKAISGSRKESPYPTIPCCKNGENMPDGLWDCAQQCFQYEPPERPAADLLAQSIQEIATAAAPSNTYIFTMGKDKQTAQPEKPLPTVQFGPLDIVLSAEETFAQIVEGLFKVVKTGALSEPVSVERRQDHLWLRFPTLLEANNFAMTWTVYRFHPYVDVVALVMGDE